VSDFVVDNSVVMSWAFEDEASEYADRVLDSLAEASAKVPSVWPMEVANVLVVAERRGRQTEADSYRFLTLLKALPIQVVSVPTHAMPQLLSLAREHQLSAYDAAYLSLAIDSGLSIATLDSRLRAAATRAGVPLWLSRQA